MPDYAYQSRTSKHWQILPIVTLLKKVFILKHLIHISILDGKKGLINEKKSKKSRYEIS
jgi:hypothetical protein